MFFNNRKTIGIIAENTTNELQNKICDGAIRTARDLGYNFAVFSAHGTCGQTSLFRKGDAQFYQLPPYEELSGLILILDTMDNEENKQLLIDTVKKRCTCPIVSMRLEYPGFHSVLVDNSTCMEGLIRHFIEHHGFKKLCFMTGPQGHEDAKQRLACFRQIMAEYGLPVGEHQLYYGDFWKYQGPEACNWFLNGQEKPDAILCANDYMAVAVASELIARGYHIPGDIAVCGYDGLDFTVTFSPSMTTARAPFYEMGKEATLLIDRLQGKNAEPQNIYLKSELLLRESCGCMERNDARFLNLSRRLYDKLQDDNHRSIIFSFMSSHLASVRTMNELSVIIPEYLVEFANLRSFAICLNQDMQQDQKRDTYTDIMEVRTAIKDGATLPYVNIPFDRRQLVPIELVDDTPQVWYFAPLHFLDYCLGYEAFRFEDEEPAGFLNFQFDVIMYNNIYDTLVAAKMDKIIAELEGTSLRDALTGLYNRGGFNKFGDQLFKSNQENGHPVFLAVVDMDNLKVVNDRYGHVEGDFAIKKVANTIKACCADKFIFGRTGGDEFYVIGQGLQEEEGIAYMNRIEEELIAFNAVRSKEYDIHVSYGHYMDVPNGTETLDDFIKVADRFMYHNKIENKKKRGESLR